MYFRTYLKKTKSSKKSRLHKISFVPLEGDHQTIMLNKGLNKVFVAGAGGDAVAVANATFTLAE
ncbi:hypothetical protein [[Mycoplasma] imitans]|uniref:hypothetical protein n=1 Tax=[Mycoplasma] imitans TaxID=29560 RepID=UPI00048700DA|nr:hypothetical protein [[Mycoplasma] imitans]